MGEVRLRRLGGGAWKAPILEGEVRLKPGHQRWASVVQT